MISATADVVPLGFLRARPLQRWLNSLKLHPKLDRRETLSDTYMSPSFTPMGGQGALSPRTPPQEHSIEEDSGETG